MTKTITATFDGEVLRPSDPLELDVNSTYVITIRSVDDDGKDDASITEQLNRVYSEINIGLDPVLARMRDISLFKEEW